MTQSEAVEEIQRELTSAEQAAARGNAGMARVSARRAAGIAIGYWLQSRPDLHWGADAIARLRAVATASELSMDIRQAAASLSAHASQTNDTPSPAAALEACRRMVRHFLA